MKKILFFAFALVMTASISFAAEASTASTNSSKGNVVLQLEGGIALPISSDMSNYFDMGFGGEIMVGYAVSPEFTLGVEGGYTAMNYSLTKIMTQYLGFPPPAGLTATIPPLNHIPVELVGQYNINTGDGSVKPYFLLGVGLAMDSIGGTVTATYQGHSGTYTIPNESWTNLEVDPGFGVAFKAGDSMNIFVQGKLAMDFAPNVASGSTKPETTNDSPIMLLPIQAGINFSFQ